MCDKNRPLYIATDDFDPDFQAAIVKAGCLSYPQVFGNVGVTDAFGSFLLDILTMTLRTERTFFVLGGSSDNGMISQLQEFEAGAGTAIHTYILVNCKTVFTVGTLSDRANFHFGQS